MTERKVLFDITTESLSHIAESIKDSHDDSMLILAPLSGNISVHAPVKKGKHKGYHRFKFEVWLPEDAIKGDSALGDFGALTLIRLPKNRVSDHLIREED